MSACQELVYGVPYKNHSISTTRYSSQVKASVTDFLPPIMLRKLRNLARKVRKNKVQLDGYQNRDLVDLVLFKNLTLRSVTNIKNLDIQSIKTIAAVGMAIGGKSKINVLDFGGGAGHHQFIARTIFKDADFDWTVVETESMCKAAQSKITDQGLEFTSSLGNLTDSKFFDLIFSNSAIQYTENPIEELRRLLGFKFNIFFITRIPLTFDEKSVTYNQESMLSQNGPGLPPENFRDRRVKYLINIESKENFERLLNENLEHWTSVEEGAWDPNRFGNEVGTFSYIGIGKKHFNPH